MKPEHLRASRNWLGWTQQELAGHAQVGLSTVKDFESGKRTPMTNNLLAIKVALEAAGMVFTENSVSGPIVVENREKNGVFKPQSPA